MGGHLHVSAALAPGETRYSYKRLGGPRGRSGRVRDSIPPIVEPVASHYTELSQPKQNVYLSIIEYVNCLQPSFYWGLKVSSIPSKCIMLELLRHVQIPSCFSASDVTLLYKAPVVMFAPCINDKHFII